MNVLRVADREPVEPAAQITDGVPHDRPSQRSARRSRALLAVCLLSAMTGLTCSARADDPQELIGQIKSVDSEGENHAVAQAAVARLSAADASVLPTLLKAFRDANPLAANWLRGVFETIADRTLESGESLPRTELLAFIRQRDNHPNARRLAYEWLLKQDPSLSDALIPDMLTDPSPEFRRDAVAHWITQGRAALDQGRDSAAREAFQKALSGAVDQDQVKTLVQALAKLDVDVDLQRHFGFLTDWRIIGPFDNRNQTGFAASYPPESELDLDATYDGQLGKVSWTTITTDDDYGVVNIAKSIENYKGSVMYLTTAFHSDRPRSVEFRLGTPNAWKLWVNGEQLFGREEYHRGSSLDQYRVPAQLKAGENIILLKLCQNEQTQDWAQRYQVQIRVSDASGAAVLPHAE